MLATNQSLVRTPSVFVVIYAPHGPTGAHLLPRSRYLQMGCAHIISRASSTLGNCSVAAAHGHYLLRHGACLKGCCSAALLSVIAIKLTEWCWWVCWHVLHPHLNVFIMSLQKQVMTGFRRNKFNLIPHPRKAWHSAMRRPVW